MMRVVSVERAWPLECAESTDSESSGGDPINPPPRGRDDDGGDYYGSGPISPPPAGRNDDDYGGSGPVSPPPADRSDKDGHGGSDPVSPPPKVQGDGNARSAGGTRDGDDDDGDGGIGRVRGGGLVDVEGTPSSDTCQMGTKAHIIVD